MENLPGNLRHGDSGFTDMSFEEYEKDQRKEAKRLGKYRCFGFL